MGISEQSTLLCEQKLLTSRQIFRYAVPARTVTKSTARWWLERILLCHNYRRITIDEYRTQWRGNQAMKSSFLALFSSPCHLLLVIFLLFRSSSISFHFSLPFLSLPPSCRSISFPPLWPLNPVKGSRASTVSSSRGVLGGVPTATALLSYFESRKCGPKCLFQMWNGSSAWVIFSSWDLLS